jgi:AraC-like DNA-binding protein
MHWMEQPRRTDFRRDTVAPELANPADPVMEGSSLTGCAMRIAEDMSLVLHGKEVAQSWKRCTVEYRVDRESRSTPDVVTQGELKVFREPLSNIIVHARQEIDRLYAILRRQSYVLLLCNSEGVAIHHRGDEARADDYKKFGIWLGGVWSERVEGTNGIGTCIAEKRPVLVHCSEHYRTRHAGLSCAGAPIFDATGRLAAVLDASRADREGAGQMPSLVLAATVAAARAIEERIFREFFRHAWTVAAAPGNDEDQALLLAIDEDQRVIGADRVGRVAFALTDKKMADGVHLSTLFGYDPSLFRPNSGQDISVRLMRVESDHCWDVLITPPLTRSREARSWAETIVQSQPRLNELGQASLQKSSQPSRGGLPPGVAHRIREYIDAHLEEKIGLEALATMAGLSTHHFARAFRQSVGVPPHSYLLRRRLAHVERMLRETQMPLSEIALAAGFSDHSHLARHFRRHTGMAPSFARWKER